MTQRASNSSEVISAECLFCVYFGREVKVGSKRKNTANIKYFTRPFRADNYKQHHEQQHPIRWNEYKNASMEDKQTFFEQSRPVKETLHAFFGPKQTTRRFLINAPIVNVIIGDMLWNPDDIDGDTHARMMAAFEDVADESELLEAGEGVDRRCVLIKNSLQFSLAIDYLRAGCSFKQAARIMLATKERTGLAAVGSCSDSTISKYARFACAINMQKISELLACVWTFSVALDMSTHMSSSYLDIRIRLHHSKSGIINLHLLAIPVFERHTAEVIFETADKALTVLCPSWKDIVVGVSTDGERKMTGRVSGVATRFEQMAKPGFVRIWCGAHQLDIVMQRAYTEFGNDEFYGHLTAAISYLRRQQNLIADMQSKAPKVADTRWESMSTVATWFKKHKVAVDAFFESKKPACAPPSVWWAQIMVVDYFASRATITFKQLQGHTVTVSEQRQHLASLQAFYLAAVDGKGPLTEDESGALDAEEWVLSTCSRFAGKIAKAESLIQNRGSFVQEKIGALLQTEMDALAKDVLRFFLNAAAGISTIVAERDSLNESGNEAPAVMPHELVRLEHSDFCSIVVNHRERLLARWTTNEIDLIEQEHQDLVLAYCSEPQLQSALNACDGSSSFNDAWSIVEGRFSTLLRFCGGLASVFPGTSQVESDFSVVKNEKDIFRMALTDLSLEGVLHSKQFDMLSSLETL